MRTVACYDVDNNADLQKVCVVKFDGRKVTFEGKPSVINFIKRGTVVAKGRVKPEEGEVYMDALTIAFSGSRFFAVEEK